MNVKELRDTIGEIQDICEAAGAAKAAADLSELVQLFDGHDAETVDAFLEHLRSVYVPSKPRKLDVPTADLTVVDTYISRLREAGSSELSFNRLFQNLSTDPQVGKAEANLIQHAYIGGREAWPTKKAALDAIQKWFANSRYQSSVLEDIKKVTPW